MINAVKEVAEWCGTIFLIPEVEYSFVPDAALLQQPWLGTGRVVWGNRSKTLTCTLDVVTL